MNRLTHFRQDTSGAVAVEFMLIAPLLFAMLFGIVTLGYAMGLSHSVQHLASGAARASVAGLDASERGDLAQAYLDQAGARYPLLNAAAISPDVAVTDGADAAITIDIAYAIDASMLGIATSFLGLDISHIEGSAYVAY